jgi:hypothetical protein
MRFFRICLAVLALSPLSAYASASNDVNLGSGPYAVLANSTVTNTGDTVVFGNLGLYPGTSITGFTFSTPPGPGMVNGTVDNDDANAMTALVDAGNEYTTAMGEPCPGTNNLNNAPASGELGGLTLTPGVYCFPSSSADLTGTLTLNNDGNPDAVFIFQIGSTLTTAANNASVVFTNGVDPDVIWQVGSSATLQTDTLFVGTIIAEASVTLDTGADITCGGAYALTGAVTMDDNTVTTEGCFAMGEGVPEPSTASFLLLLGVPGWLWLRKTRRGKRSL